MDLATLFQYYVLLFTFAFCLTPISLCITWYKRDSSDGYSAINLVFPLVVTSCWLRYSLLLNDFGNILLNSLILMLFAGYVFCYDVFQTNKKSVHMQLTAGAVVFVSIYLHIDRLDHESAVSQMGSIAATMQMVSMSGFFYELYRVLTLKTTEYLPSAMTFGGLIMGLQWCAYAILAKDMNILYANAFGVLLNILVVILYAIYPPLTWRVPFIGTGPQQPTRTEKKQQ